MCAPRARSGVSVLVLAGAVALGALAAPARAQSLRPPEAGDWVRIASPDISGKFFVTALRSDTLVLRLDPASADFAVGMGSLYRLQIREGAHSRLTGGLGGAVIGALVGGFWAIPCTHLAPHLWCESISARQRIGIGVGVGVLAGVLVWGGRDRWGPAALVAQPGSAR
jgi:hypothetical protein